MHHVHAGAFAPDPATVRRGDLPLGTIVFTADGALPVEYLSAGDRIVTRAGMRVLRGIDTPAPAAFRLRFDRAEVIYADGAQVACA